MFSYFVHSPISLQRMLTEKEVARHLLEIGAVKLSPSEPFTWASGLRSPIYCDNRMVLSYPPIRAKIKKAFGDISRTFPEFDMIAGVATAGIAHGALLADELDLPFIYVRSKAKKHGRQNLIEGSYTEGSTCLVVEDLISTGGSALQAVEALRANNLNVAGVVAIFTYMFGQAEERFQAADCPYKTLSNYNALIDVITETGHMTDEEIKSLRVWNSDPEGWSKNFEK